MTDSSGKKQIVGALTRTRAFITHGGLVSLEKNELAIMHVYLMSQSNETGEAYPSNENVAVLAFGSVGFSRAVTTGRNGLVAKGRLELVRPSSGRPGDTSVYRIVVPIGCEFQKVKPWNKRIGRVPADGIPLAMQPVPAVDETGAIDDGDGCQWRTGRVPADGALTPQLTPHRTHSLSGECEAVPSEQTKAVPFDLFKKSWPTSPQATGWTSVAKLWNQNDLDAVAGEVIKALQRWKATSKWQADGGRWIPRPSKFLEEEQWRDPPPIQSNGMRYHPLTPEELRDLGIDAPPATEPATLGFRRFISRWPDQTPSVGWAWSWWNRDDDVNTDHASPPAAAPRAARFTKIGSSAARPRHAFTTIARRTLLRTITRGRGVFVVIDVLCFVSTIVPPSALKSLTRAAASSPVRAPVSW